MNNLKVEIVATYVEEVDCTVIWQYMYFGTNTASEYHEPVQTTIIGWYYGEPNEASTEEYAKSTVIAQYWQ